MKPSIRRTLFQAAASHWAGRTPGGCEGDHERLALSRCDHRGHLARTDLNGLGGSGHRSSLRVGRLVTGAGRNVQPVI